MTTTKIIGPNGGADYATPALWFASFAATLTDDQVGNFQNAEVTVTAAQTLTGITVAGHTVLMTAGAGNSFVDNANKLTNALRYNASNGAGLRLTTGTSNLLDIQIDGFTLSRLQLKKDTNYNYVAAFTASGGSTTVDQCIFQSAVNQDVALRVGTTNPSTVKNCLVFVHGVSPGMACAGGDCIVQDVTIVTNSAGSGVTGFANTYGVPALKNVVVAGFATDYSGTAGTCANNATDQGAFGGTNYGTSGQVSVVAATEFFSVSSGSEDYRVNVATSVKLLANGTNTGTPSTDIVGTTRASPTTIGAWEAGTATTPSGRGGVFLPGFPG